MAADRIKACERCGSDFVCGANNPEGGCACNSVQLTSNQLTLIREQFGDCLCVACLQALSRELPAADSAPT